MFSLRAVLRFVIYAIIVIAVLGLLWWLIGYCEANIPAPPMVWVFVRVGFVIMVVLAICYFLLSLLDGGPPGPNNIFRP